jgi:hypothetical protein
MPVMLPRESDGDMRRDGSSAAFVQPKHPVAERGGPHGAPGLDRLAEERIAASCDVLRSRKKGKRRWKTVHPKYSRLGRQDKGPRGAARSGCWFFWLRAAISRGARQPRAVRVRDFVNGLNVFRTSREKWP